MRLRQVRGFDGRAVARRVREIDLPLARIGGHDIAESIGRTGAIIEDLPCSGLGADAVVGGIEL